MYVERRICRTYLSQALTFLLLAAFLPIQSDATPPPNGLVAWFPANGNFDDVAGPHDGTPIGGVTFATGKTGQAFSFDGVNDEIKLNHSAALEFGSADSFTIAAWINPTLPFFDTSPFPTGTVVSLTYFCNVEAIFLAVIQRPFLSIRDSAFNTGFVQADPLTSGEWRHVVGVRAAGDAELRFYVDGVLANSIPDATGTAGGTFTRPDSFVTQPDRIGAIGKPCATKRYFRGLIDEVQIYDRALIDSEIEILAGRIWIDIKPDAEPNSVRPGSKGKIPVAILSNESFSTATIDVSTILFGATGTEAAPQHAAFEDVDLDGDPDLIVHFRSRQTGIACGDTMALLTATTLDGQALEGADSINTVGCRSFSDGNTAAADWLR